MHTLYTRMYIIDYIFLYTVLCSLRVSFEQNSFWETRVVWSRTHVAKKKKKNNNEFFSSLEKRVTARRYVPTTYTYIYVLIFLRRASLQLLPYY